MSFLAKLTIDDQEYNVLSCSFEVAQPVHHGSGRPIGMPILNNLHILIESNSNTGFFGWSISAYEKKDGEIVFFKRDAMASSRVLKFTNAFCINYKETFENENSYPMVTKIVLAVETLDLDDSTYNNPSIDQQK